MNFFDFLTDPVLRAPTWGTLFMCIASSLMGVLLFLKKQTLLSETLSHAAYPGVVVGLAAFGLIFPKQEEWSFIAVLSGAFFSSLLGLKAMNYLQQKQKMASDAALCFVLAFFFGVGIVAISIMQTILPSWHKQIQMLLFGQAATMMDIHIALYGGLSLLVILFFIWSFYPLQGMLFDSDFAKSIGMRVDVLRKIVFWLLLVSLVMGMRSVGVVLMSGMIIAPAVAARAFTNSLHKMFVLAALFGALSGLLGNIFSVYGSIYFSTTLPTGPMIVLFGSGFAIFSLLFAPQNGWVFRKIRVSAFHFRCLEENILKILWKKRALSFDDCRSHFRFSCFFALRRLLRQGWIVYDQGIYSLSEDGKHKAAAIVRLHRLWELYLAQELNFEPQEVHKTAEEMEHILTPDLEERLTRLLANPQKDPHQQPIPSRMKIG